VTKQSVYYTPPLRNQVETTLQNEQIAAPPTDGMQLPMIWSWYSDKTIVPACATHAGTTAPFWHLRLLPHQKRLDVVVEVAVEYVLYVGALHAGAGIFDQLVRV
jgi:hypothetical protein